MNERSADVILSSEGAAFWVSHKTFESACLMDLTYYPFDEQSCVLWFQSLTSNSEKLVLEIYPPGFDIKTLLSDFREADTWEITASSAEVIRYPSDEGEVLVYSRRRSIRIRLTLKRRPGFTAYLLTVPCVVLSCMKLLVFALPAEGLERHSAGKNHQWRHNGRDGVSNHQPHHCLLNRLFRRTSKKTSKFFRMAKTCVPSNPKT